MNAQPNNWKLVDSLKSNQDNTIKLVFLSDSNQIAEVSYINKNDGKDILCVPTQTSCKLGCKFCHLSDLDIPVRSFSAKEISSLVSQALLELNLSEPNHTLLISYMGSGEPLLNIDGVIGSAKLIKENWFSNYRTVRFAIASVIPAVKLAERFTQRVAEEGLNFKFHLSLHAAFDEVRKELLPAAVPISNAIDVLCKYMNATGNAVEAHYTLMDNVNDKSEDVNALVNLLSGLSIPIKILRYSERGNVDLKRSDNASAVQALLEKNQIKAEIYSPPGNDIGSSCGQFLTEYYKKFSSPSNKKSLPVISE